MGYLSAKDLRADRIRAENSRNGELESIVSVSVLLAERPDDALIQLLGLDITLLGNLGDDRVDGLSLFVLFLTFDDLFRRDSSL